MVDPIGIEEADRLLTGIRKEKELTQFGSSWRYWIRNRSKSKNTIKIGDIEVPFFVIRRKICVDKHEFLNKATTKTNKEREWIIKRVNGPIEVKGHYTDQIRHKSSLPILILAIYYY